MGARNKVIADKGNVKTLSAQAKIIGAGIWIAAVNLIK